MKRKRRHQTLPWRGGVGRKRTRMHDYTTPDANLAEMTDTDDLPEMAYFRKNVFYVLIDNVIAGLTLRFNSVKRLAENFDFSWKYPTMSEMQYLPLVHKAIY